MSKWEARSGLSTATSLDKIAKDPEGAKQTAESSAVKTTESPAANSAARAGSYAVVPGTETTPKPRAVTPPDVRADEHPEVRADASKDAPPEVRMEVARVAAALGLDKKKPRPVKVTFDLYPDVAENVETACRLLGHGSKIAIANRALEQYLRKEKLWK